MQSELPAQNRRRLLQSVAGMAITTLPMKQVTAAASGNASANPPSKASEQSSSTSGPSGSPPPGKPGDFDFLAGEWRIQHRRLDPASAKWEDFIGEATCWTVLGGVGSVEELRIPARNFSGMGLRLLDMKTQVWRDFWVNAKSGVLTPPGMPGHFIRGEGLFEADDMDGDQPIKVRGIWDQITPRSCRWRQAVSRDGGKTWEENWIMHWQKQPA